MAALAVSLLALLTLMSPEGSIHLGRRHLRPPGGLAGPRHLGRRLPAAPLDPAGAELSLLRTLKAGDSWTSPTSDPAYPVLLVVGRRLAGPVYGLHLFPLLGALAAAGAVWLLAAELDRGSTRAAFWLVAASPVVANGYLLWADSLDAALAGLAIAAAVRVVRGGPRRWSSPGWPRPWPRGHSCDRKGSCSRWSWRPPSPSTRLETSWIRRGRRRPPRRRRPHPLAMLVERRWTAAIVGGDAGTLRLRESTASSASYLGGRISGGWHELFGAHYSDPGAAVPVLLTFGLVVGLGFLALRQWGPPLPARSGSHHRGHDRGGCRPHDPVPRRHRHGPVHSLAPGSAGRAAPGPSPGRRGPRGWRDRVVLAAMAGFLAAVLLTQYAEGGGLEWGGRFLSPMVVPVAVLAVIGFRRRLARLPRPDRGLATACLSLVAVATAGLGISTIAVGQAANDRVIAAFSRHPAPVMVTTVPDLGLLAWRTHDQLTWMLTDEEGFARPAPPAGRSRPLGGGRRHQPRRGAPRLARRVERGRG